jgi:hypothetical protein
MNATEQERGGTIIQSVTISCPRPLRSVKVTSASREQGEDFFRPLPVVLF